MNISDITVLEDLKGLLSGNVTVDASGTVVPVYCDTDLPNDISVPDLIVIEYNSAPSSFSKEFGCLVGSVMVSYFCETLPNGTIKKSRIGKVLNQLQNLLNEKSTEKYYFALNIDNFVTPPSADQSTGYSIVTLNVDWHTV